MPTGKGVLRIAIEDFLNTFHLTDKVKTLTKDVGEHHEQMISDEFQSMLDNIHAIPGMENIMKLSYNPDGTLKNQGSILTFAGLAAGVGGQLSSALLAPWGRLLNYRLDRGAKSARLDPMACIAGNWRSPEGAALFTSDLSDQGYNTDRTMYLTKLSRPRLDVQDWLHLKLRGVVSDNDYRDELTRKGFLPEDISKTIELGKIIPSISDLVAMAVKEGFDDTTSARFGYDNEYPSEVEQWAGKQGLDPIWVKRYWRAHWQLPSVTLAYEMLHRLRPGETDTPFTDADMDLLLKAADYPTFWRSRMKKVSYNPYTRVDIRRMYKLGILTRDQVKKAYMDDGYDSQHAENLTAFTVMYETESGASKLDGYQDLSLSLAKQMYKLGIIDKTTFRDHILKLQYVPEVADLIIELCDSQNQVDNVPDKMSSLITNALDNYITAYRLRIITRNDATNYLARLQLPTDQITLALDQADFEYSLEQRNNMIKALKDAYVSGSLDRGSIQAAFGKMNLGGSEQSQIMQEFDDLRNVRSRRLTESQYKKLWAQGVISKEQFKEYMINLGFDDQSVEYLLILDAPGSTENE